MNVRKPFRIQNYKFPSGRNPVDLPSICQALNLVATEHAQELGILRGFDPARDCGWVILDMNLRVLAGLSSETKVHLETWIAAIEGARLIREFCVFTVNAHGQRDVFVEAAQAFVLFDRNSRRPVLPSRERRQQLEGSGRTFQFSVTLSRRTVHAEIPTSLPVKTSLHTVVESEVDHNGHLNHAEYLAWIESLKNPVGEIAVEYLREARLADRIHVRTWHTPDDLHVFTFSPNETDSAATASPVEASTMAAVIRHRPATGSRF